MTDNKIIDGDDVLFRSGDVEPWRPKYRFRKVLFKECAIAGLSFHIGKNDELWDELEAETALALVRDSKNRHDPNAVAVALADDYDVDSDDFDFDFILGYIPQADNAELAALFDAGYAAKFSAVVSSFRRYSEIRIKIFIESNEPELVRPDLLRAESVDFHEFREVVSELAERGTTCRRFGGFPPSEYLLPIVGEKIVIVHTAPDGVILYLMRVLAEGDDCSGYVDDPASLICCDDTAPFILTNIMGPVKIAKSDHGFLCGVDLKNFTATKYLDPTLSGGFNRLFSSVLFRTINRYNIDVDPSIDGLRN